MLNSIMGNNYKNRQFPVFVDIDSLNQFFCNLGANAIRNICPTTHFYIYLTGNYPHSLFLTPIVPAEVCSIVQNLRNKSIHLGMIIFRSQ